MATCVVPNCGYKQIQKNIFAKKEFLKTRRTLVRFPLEEKRKHQWIQAIPDLDPAQVGNNSKICHTHFEPRFIVLVRNILRKNQTLKSFVLSKKAVPTRFPPGGAIEKENESNSDTTTELATEEDYDTDEIEVGTEEIFENNNVPCDVIKDLTPDKSCNQLGEKRRSSSPPETESKTFKKAKLLDVPQDLPALIRISDITRARRSPSPKIDVCASSPETPTQRYTSFFQFLSEQDPATTRSLMPTGWCLFKQRAGNQQFLWLEFHHVVRASYGKILVNRKKIDIGTDDRVCFTINDDDFLHGWLSVITYVKQTDALRDIMSAFEKVNVCEGVGSDTEVFSGATAIRAPNCSVVTPADWVRCPECQDLMNFTAESASTDK